MEHNFKKVHTGKDLTISFIIIAAGIGLFFLNKGLGLTISTIGILCLLLYKAGYKHNGKGELLTAEIFELSMSCKSSLTDFLSGRSISPYIKKGTEGGSLRLNVYSNKDKSTVYAQLFEFCHFAYEQVTEVTELHSPESETLFAQL